MKHSYKPNNNRFYLYCNFEECASFMANIGNGIRRTEGVVSVDGNEKYPASIMYKKAENVSQYSGLKLQ